MNTKKELEEARAEFYNFFSERGLQKIHDSEIGIMEVCKDLSISLNEKESDFFEITFLKSFLHGFKYTEKNYFIKKTVTQDSIFKVNYEGYATIFENQSWVFESKNAVKDFSFRSYKNAEDMDGTDFCRLDYNEIEKIFSVFEFERVIL